MIEEILKRIISVAESDSTNFCVTLEAKDNPSKWVQLTWDNLNFAYPFEIDPMIKVKEEGLPSYPYMELTDWEQGTYATFSHGGYEFKEISTFIASYMTTILNMGTDEANLTIKEELL